MKTAADEAAGMIGATDEALVLRAQNGSIESFAEIVSRFEERLLNFIIRRLGGRRMHSDAEDLTQETFLRAWRSLGQYRPRCRFSTWLFTIASRLVIDHRRRLAVQATALDQVTAEETRSRREEPRSSDGDEQSAGAHLWNVAAQILTDEQHAALWLRYAEDLAPGEIARVLDKNEVAVRVLLFRARQSLEPHAAMTADCEVNSAGPSLAEAANVIGGAR